MPQLFHPFWCSWCALSYFEHPIVDDLVRQSYGVLDRDKALEISTKIGDFVYNNLMANGVVSGQNLMGIHKDYVKEWNRNEFLPRIGGVEYVVKP